MGLVDSHFHKHGKLRKHRSEPNVSVTFTMTEASSLVRKEQNPPSLDWEDAVYAAEAVAKLSHAIEKGGH